MSLLLLLTAVVIVAVAVVRSTWSPCALSMVSTLTPLAERSRGRRWWLAAGWFVVGATLGGLSSGLVLAVPAAAVGALEIGIGWRTTVVGLAAVVAGVWDLRSGRGALPHHRRQVDERWVDRYRQWVTAGGWGAQIGTGWATYIMTSGVYLAAVAAVATGSATAAVALGAGFGLLRGLAVFLGVRIDRPERLVRMHRRLDASAMWSRSVVAGVWFAIAALSLGAVWSPGAGGAVVASALAVVAVTRRSGRPIRRSDSRSVMLAE